MINKLFQEQAKEKAEKLFILDSLGLNSFDVQNFYRIQKRFGIRGIGVGSAYGQEQFNMVTQRSIRKAKATHSKAVSRGDKINKIFHSHSSVPDNMNEIEVTNIGLAKIADIDDYQRQLEDIVALTQMKVSDDSYDHKVSEILRTYGIRRVSSANAISKGIIAITPSR